MEKRTRYFISLCLSALIISILAAHSGEKLLGNRKEFWKEVRNFEKELDSEIKCIFDSKNLGRGV